MNSETEILDDLLDMMSRLADDWEYSGTVTADTYLLHDLGLESLDLVVLGAAIQQRYGRIPFTEFLADIGARPIDKRDVTVGELVTFIGQHRESPLQDLSR